MTLEDVIKKAEQELGMLSTCYEAAIIPSVRRRYLEYISWLAPLIRLAKSGLEAEEGVQNESLL